MTIDTQIFFLIVIGGVITIWSFRKVTGSKKDLKEIEYLVFACIWGTLLVTTYSEIMKFISYDKLSDLLGNPFATGLVFPTYGLMIGVFVGSLDRRLKIRTRLFKALKFLEKKIFND